VTSTTDAAGHPDVDELSDLSEGLLPPSRTADVRRHLDDCVPCADVYDSLEEIRGLLGTLPGPARMPDDVASRIDAALAAEALLNATAPGTADAAPAEPVATHVSRETPPSSPTDRPSGHARAGTGPGRTKQPHRGRRRTAALAGVFTAAAVGLSALLVQTLSDDTSKPPTASQQHTDAAHTYSEGALPSQVANLLAGKTDEGRSSSAKPWGAESNADKTGTTGTTGMQPNKTFQDTTGNVPPCIQQAITTNQTVLAADKGVYRGTAVYLVVTPDAADSNKVTAYIIDAACVKRASASPGKVLLTQSYARP
jgi:hypothetical protein